MLGAAQGRDACVVLSQAQARWRRRYDNDLRRGLLDVKLTSEVLTSSGQIRQDAESEVRTRLHGLRDELHTLAQKELEI